MKKILLLSICILPAFSFAQITKGKIFLNGTLSASATNTNTYYVIAGNNVASTVNASNSVSFSPGAGYLLSDKLAIMANYGYTANFQEFVNYRTSSSSNSIGISLRRYYGISDKFYFAIEGGPSYTNRVDKVTLTTTYQEYEFPSYSISLNVSPKFIFFPSSHWSVEGGLGSIYYSHYQNTATNVCTNTQYFNWSGGLSLGVSYYFH